MVVPELPDGYIRVLVELPKDQFLVEASRDWLEGRDPTANMQSYARQASLGALEIDHGYGAVPIGAGGRSGTEVTIDDLRPDNSDHFLVRAFIKAGINTKGSPPLEGKFLIHADPAIAGMLTCGNTQAVGKTIDVQTRLRSEQLNRAGYDGSRVAIAIVDTGIYLNRITTLLGDLTPGTAPAHDAADSWTPRTVATEAFKHALGHGSMCAYDALIAAPKATLLDIAMLLDRAPGDHGVPGTVSAAIKAYLYLANIWLRWLAMGAARPYDALVVSNSWGIYHPSLEPASTAIRFIDNPNHAFRRYFVRPLSLAGIDILFASNNCGSECPSATCLSKTTGMIMGANAYEEVLTIGGCDTNNDRVGYSSQGPSIAGMYPNKPDLTAYTHFLGSKTARIWAPDTGVSAACPVAAGCVAALRTGLPPTTTRPRILFDALRATATTGNGSTTPGGVWNEDYGCGIINPVDAALSLGLSV